MSLPATLPEKFDPAVPLADVRYERFAQLRVMGVPTREACREAGLPLSGWNHTRYDRHPEVVARKAYLAKDDADIVAATRLDVREQLMLSAKLDVIGEFGLLKVETIDGKKVCRVVGVDWKKMVASGKSAAITKFRFDSETGVLVDFDRDDRMQAISQLRDMYGLRAARRMEMTGKGGGPVLIVDPTKLTHDQLINFESILASAATSGHVEAGEGGDREAPSAPESGERDQADQPSLDLPSNGR